MKTFRELEFEDINSYKILVGEYGDNLKSISRMLGVNISSRGTKIFISGEKELVAVAEDTIKNLYDEIRGGFAISRSDVEEKVYEIKRRNLGKGVESEGGRGEESEWGELLGHAEVGAFDRVEKGNKLDERSIKQPSDNVIIVTYRGKKIVPRTGNQRNYVYAMEGYDVVFALGPAGTGKTYLAVAFALKMLKSGQVAKIILTRPAVEAGEKIGYLPGGILEKVDPFMRPIYDCLYDILDYREITKYMERGVIEIIPVAFMRGRTLSDAFIIVDEAQNLTYEQVKMTLTRMGLGSKMVLTADMSQIDIQRSGLSDLEDVLGGVEGIKFVHLSKEDVVRHPVVSRIIQALEEYEKKSQK